MSQTTLLNDNGGQIHQGSVVVIAAERLKSKAEGYGFPFKKGKKS